MMVSRWIVALLATFTAGLHADEVPSPADNGVPPFHRTYIPADEIGKRHWPGSYLPLDAKEFEQLLETVRSGAAGAPGIASAVLSSSELDATLTGQDLLVGTMTLRLQRRAAANTALVLDACNLAISRPVWSDQHDRAAQLAIGDDGRIRLAVGGSELKATWALRGERTPSGMLGFRLQLPKSPTITLALNLPKELELQSDRGLVTRSAPNGEGLVRWNLELGGHWQVELRLVPEESARERRPLTLLRQTTAYEFTPRGVNVSAQLRLDVHGEPLKRIVVDLDPGLRLVAARSGELEIPWSISGDPQGTAQATLELPEPIQGSDRVVQLTAIAPLVTGTAWRMPGMRPQGLAWQEGTAQILVPSLFVLERMDPDGCRQSRLTALPAPLSGETIEVQFFRPNAALDVVVAPARERPSVQTASAVEIGTNGIQCRSVLALSLRRGQRRAISVGVQGGWTIDSVEALESTVGASWEVDDSAPQQALLKITLPGPLTADKPVRLAVRGHRSLPTDATFRAERLQMLAFDSLQPTKRIIAVSAAEGTELNWRGPDELTRQDVEQLTPGEAALFAQPISGQMYIEDGAFREASLSMERRRASYTADIRIDAVAQRQSLTETYTIQCVPDSSRVERLLIHLSQERSAPLEWNIAGGNPGEFSARRLSAAEQLQSGIAAGGEVWELNLQLARPGAFELRGVRSTDFTSELPIALASVAEAVSQRGSLAIRALGDTGLSIQNRRLSAVPAELLESDRYQTSRAAYHYQPGRDDLAGDAAVSVAPRKPLQIESGAWAWSQRLESRYGKHSPASHLCRIELQTAGRQHVRVWLPDVTRPLEVWIDDRRMPPSTVAADGSLVLELPAGKAFVAIGISFQSSDALPSLVASYSAPFPRLDCPVLTRQWTVKAPTGYSIFGTAGRVYGDSSELFGWSQRMFGAIGRSPYHHKLFNPLSPDDWQVVGAGHLAARQSAEQFVQTLDRVARQYANDEALTWGQLLALCSDTEVESQHTLLVDGGELQAAGISYKTLARLPAPSELSAPSGAAILENAGLRLLVSDGHLLVTTVTGAHSAAGAAPIVGDRILGVSSRSPLAEELQQAARDGVHGRFQTVDAWLASPPAGETPWALAQGSGPSAEAAHWQVHRLHYASTDDAQIRISNLSGMGSISWAVFLAVLASGLWIRQWTRSLLLAVAGLAGFAALVLPAAYVAPFSAAFLAALAALAVNQIHREPQDSRTRELSKSHRKASTSVRGLARLSLFAIVALFSWSIGSAQQPADIGAASAPAATTVDPPPATEGPKPLAARRQESSTAKPAVPLQRVFVPVDDEQRPVGGKVYLSEDFYRSLARLAAQQTDAQNPWLIHKASYQGTLSRDPTSRRLVLSKLTATFELQVLRNGVRLQLPMPRGNRSGVVAARLDGRALPIAWNESGTQLVLGPLEAERCRLEIELQPSVEADSTSAGFEISTPVHVLSTLELSFPPDAPVIEVPSARGAIRRSQQRGELSADLGGSDRLTVRWPISTGPEAPAPNLDVDELMWIKVRPGTTLIDARFKYRVLNGTVRRIVLSADPRLRLLPSANGQPLIAAVHSLPGEPQKIELELRRPIADEVVIDLSFLVTSASGVGNLRLPRLETSGARAAKRYLAVSIDPALQPRIQAGEDSRTLEIADFLAAWGASDPRPKAAYIVPRGEPVWVLSTQPNEPRVASEQTLSLNVGRSQALVQLDAQLTVSSGHLLQLNLQGPAGIAVDEVSLLADDLQRVTRWSVSPEGRITVFLNAPVDGKPKLIVRGHWSYGDATALTRPYLEVFGADVKRRQLNLYRQSAVLVQLAPSAGLSPLEATATAAPESFGSLVGQYEIASPPVPLAISLTPNSMRSRATAVTYIQRDGENWTADWHYHVQVLEGVIDTLQFEIPAQWSEPFRVNAPFKVVPLPGESRRQLIVYPSSPVSDKFELRVRGRVAPSIGDRLRVPDIHSPRDEQFDRFVVLPKQLASQQISWETLGLSLARVPEDFPPIQAATHNSYQAAGETFQATLRALERDNAISRVELADIHLGWQLDGRFEAVAAFDVDPGGASHCTLQLPENVHMVNASIEGVPAQATELAPQQWQLAFQSHQLPQHIEVVYSGAVHGGGTECRFVAPALVGLTVARTLWTVHSPRELSPASDATNGSQASAAGHELARLAAELKLVQVPAEVLGDFLPEELVRWYRPWKARAGAAREMLRWHLSSNRQGAVESAEAAQARQFDSQFQAVDRRLQGTTAGPGYASASTLSANQLLKLSLAGSTTSYRAAAGAMPSLTVAFLQPASPTPWLRWLSAVVLLVLLGSAAYGLRDQPAITCAPWLVVGAIGLVWWLFFAPSALGFFILSLAVVFAARARWKIDLRIHPHEPAQPT